MKLSIVTTLYRSARAIDEFYRRGVKAAEALGYDLEIVMVNDVSPDDSFERAESDPPTRRIAESSR
jgi:hypothetical protein